MFERLIVLCMQLMAPITLLSCSVLLPLHATGTYISSSSGISISRSNLMGLTMSNLDPGSPVMW